MTLKRPAQPFRTKWTLDVKNLGKIASKMRKNCDFEVSIATLTHEMEVGRQKTEEKLRFYLVNRNPFARNGRWTSKTEEKLRWTLSFLYKCLCVKASVCKSVCV